MEDIFRTIEHNAESEQEKIKMYLKILILCQMQKMDADQTADVILSAKRVVSCPHENVFRYRGSSKCKDCDE